MDQVERGWTRHGHAIKGMEQVEPRPKVRARCGGQMICPECKADAAIAKPPLPGLGRVETPSDPVGFGRKYIVQKINDPTGKHADCQFFVLDLAHDPHARAALRAYAEALRTDNTRESMALAGDIEWIIR